jgi:hypothetical protein
LCFVGFFFVGNFLTGHPLPVSALTQAYCSVLAELWGQGKPAYISLEKENDL